MKVCVELGLLCLSLLISSLHGEEIDTESSKQMPPNLDEEDIPQLQMYRVRRQTEEKNEEKSVASSQRENSKHVYQKTPQSGQFSILRDNGGPKSDVNLRVKRQEKNKNNKRKKPRPAQFSLLGSNQDPPQQTVRAKREETAGGKRP
ncbi:uncharacterized protein si:ch211-106h4.12 isoform X1 [Danio rerio]|uniref:Uncharacterized protein si:ch211-106h4.12 isoform X1 n=1 Tax=Danio rerio TaxID=7955 RepID=A0A8M3B7R8_DANRE|nr:uncharacterized protein si:ch211-106h4.12 isoform X1 [Danio rerio]|eukprot:XP_009296868.1 uncharacterized protein si:ch211-106h4.12 isoform X1 [Danio rerio]